MRRVILAFLGLFVVSAALAQEANISSVPFDKTQESFALSGSQTVAVTTTSASTALTSVGSVAWVCNTGANPAHVLFSAAPATATATNSALLVSNVCMSSNSAYSGYIDAYSDTGSTSLSVTVGYGAPLFAYLPSMAGSGAPTSVNLTQIASSSILTGAGAAGGGSQRVTVAQDSTTVAGSASLPTGANVIGGVTQSGTWTVQQGTPPWADNVTQIGGAALTQGQKAMAASVPIVIASDQSTLNITNTQLPVAQALVDAGETANTTYVGSQALLFNGTNWDRLRDNVVVTLAGSSTQTTSGNTAAFTNYNAAGIVIFTNITAVSGTVPTLAVTLQGQDPVSGSWANIANTTSATYNSTGLKTLAIYPGSTATSGDIGSANAFVPRNYRVAWTIGGTTPSYTFSIGAQLNL